MSSKKYLCVAYLWKNNLSHTFQQEFVWQIILLDAIIVALDRLNAQNQFDRVSYIKEEDDEKAIAMLLVLVQPLTESIPHRHCHCHIIIADTSELSMALFLYAVTL